MPNVKEDDLAADDVAPSGKSCRNKMQYSRHADDDDDDDDDDDGDSVAEMSSSDDEHDVESEDDIDE